jgi:hypothetical protein
MFQEFLLFTFRLRIIPSACLMDMDTLLLGGKNDVVALIGFRFPMVLTHLFEMLNFIFPVFWPVLMEYLGDGIFMCLMMITCDCMS